LISWNFPIFSNYVESSQSGGVKEERWNIHWWWGASWQQSFGSHQKLFAWRFEQGMKFHLINKRFWMCFLIQWENGSLFCPTQFDGLLCWRNTKIDTIVIQPCFKSFKGVDYDVTSE
jgi:hypothetical protein